jgi:hypothetical protein
VTPARLPLREARFTAAHLLRPGEADAARALASASEMSPDADDRMAEAGEALLSARWAAYMALGEEFDGLCEGWRRAAVRVFGEGAAEGLRALQRARRGRDGDWPGAEEAEWVLEQLAASRVWCRCGERVTPGMSRCAACATRDR